MSVDVDVHDVALGALRGVFDPELAIDIVTLGLVYAVAVHRNAVLVDMALTTPGCPVSEGLPADTARALDTALEPLGYTAQVRIVWDQPWTPARLDPTAARALGLRR
jgi:metal-sulfur cluster biosynthetic enzyme